jgi:ATP-binding cassette, subfamily C, bacterial PrsD
VLYDGKLIAFGPSAEVFARVKAANGKKEPAPPQAKAEPRPALAESVPS